jgi:[protein-PII] uridylyltransferase
MRFIFASHDRTEQLQRIKEGLEDYRRRGKADPSNFRMHPAYDAMLQQMADQFLAPWSDKIAIVGLGGYGRMEMSPFSDIDILFLREENVEEGVFRGIRHILYMLWDAKVEVGHSVRTVDECEEEAQNDLAVLTSLMDIRLVWGDHGILDRLEKRRGSMIKRSDPLDLYLRIETEIAKSCAQHGHTIYLVEPNLKEGPGSLRYMQLINWLARMILDCENLADLPGKGVCDQQAVQEAAQGLEFLSEVRTRLHFLSGRRDDRLSLSAQTEMARQMGYLDSVERISAVTFMREYYRHAATMDFFGRRVLSRTRLRLRPEKGPKIKRMKLGGGYYVGAGGVNHDKHEDLGKSGSDFFTAFSKIVETGCELDIRLVDTMLGKLDLVDEDFIASVEANNKFLEILGGGPSVGKTMNTMMKIGFLERFIPDFAWVRFLPSYSSIHQYTVDLHTIMVMEHMDLFRRGMGGPEDQLLHTISSRIEDTSILYLAALFHDMAKGLGPGHEARGEVIAGPILDRLGLHEEAKRDVRFLIRNHLAMSHLAFKKDLHDEALVGRFAENVIHTRRLDMLFILTHADLRATGPGAFNSWRHMLLEELYYRTLDVIQGVDEKEENLSDWLEGVKEVIPTMVPAEYRGEELNKYLQSAPSRYLLDFYPEVIAEHYLSMMEHLKENGRSELQFNDLIAHKADHTRAGYSSITLITRDRPGLFFKMAGALSANRINILSAWSHSIGDISIATLHVNDIPEGPLDDEERWEKFKEDFSGVVNGTMDADMLVASKRTSVRPVRRPVGPETFIKVDMDNHASDAATIIEVTAMDRPGLLYDITRAIFKQGLNIYLTKIATDGNRATDIFYVRDESGGKVLDFDRLDQIKNRLREHLKAVEKAILDYR